MRRTPVSSSDLADLLTSMGRELESDNTTTPNGSEPAKFRLLVEGVPRHVHPTAQDNLYRIAREAAANGFVTLRPNA